jgi:hypothetical protein
LQLLFNGGVLGSNKVLGEKTLFCATALCAGVFCGNVAGSAGGILGRGRVCETYQARSNISQQGAVLGKSDVMIIVFCFVVVFFSNFLVERAAHLRVTEAIEAALLAFRSVGRGLRAPILG